MDVWIAEGWLQGDPFVKRAHADDEILPFAEPLAKHRHYKTRLS
jgi:hypothetical protein